VTIQELIVLSESRLAYIGELRASALATGDVQHLLVLESQQVETQITLDKLRSLV